ncbi:hypothetical protein A33K_14004 [Burkholderia humptydooensis MSMB43]|nr:hypothetical protein A33K_14004 [Burkholderia humptydooensis MSMB43]
MRDNTVFPFSPAWRPAAPPRPAAPVSRGLAAGLQPPYRPNLMTTVNLAAYRFVSLDSIEQWRPLIAERCNALGLRGTILLAPEGINLFIAGPLDATGAFVDYLRHDPLFEGKFADLAFKESLSDSQPFRRMLVRLKREIITMKMPAIKPELGRAPSVDARTLKAWLDRGRDDAGRPVVMLDTRNAFEVDVGTFDNALDYRIDKFSQFPSVIEANRADLEGKTVVSFCTGGIRCEKAAIHMKDAGIENVYQLEGGILKYFEEVGGAHYHGDCFVFDYRTALNPQLEPTADVTCFACRAVVPADAQQSPLYVPGKSCPACHHPDNSGNPGERADRPAEPARAH